MSLPEKTTEHDFAETATPQLNEKPTDLIRALIRCCGFVLDPSRKVTLSFSSKVSQSTALRSFPLLLPVSPGIVDLPTTSLLCRPVSEMCEYEFHKKQSSADIVTIRLFSRYLGKFHICLLQLHFDSYNSDLFWMDFVEMVKRPLRNMHGNLFRSFRSLGAILVIHCYFSEDFEYALQLFDQMPKCLVTMWVTITLEYTNIGFDVIALGMFKIKQKGGIRLVNFIKMNYGAHINSIVNSMIPLCLDYVCILGDYKGLEEAKSTLCNHVTYGKGRLQIVKLMDGRATDIGIFLSAHTIEALVHDHLITQREKGSHVEFPFCCVFFAHALGLFSAWVLPIFSHSKKPDYYVALFGLVYFAEAVWVTFVCWIDHSPKGFWAKEFPP